MSDIEADIRYLIMDVDGTLTDGKIYMSDRGELLKAFNVKDGYGIHNILPLCHIEPVIITGRSSEIVSRRCREIGIEKVYQGIKDKAELLEEFLKENGCRFSNIAYIGDDVNDLECMERSGIAGCPSDAAEEAKAAADFVAVRGGGDGAVREFIDWLYKRTKT